MIPVEQDILTTALKTVAAIRDSNDSFLAGDLAQNDLFMSMVDTCHRTWSGKASSATMLHLGMILGFEYARLLQTRELTEGR